MGLKISETWFNTLLLLMGAAMIVLGYFVQKWLGLNKPQSTMSNPAWAKEYERNAIRILRKLNDYATSGLGKDEVQKLKTDLFSFIFYYRNSFIVSGATNIMDDILDLIITDEKRKQVRTMADALVDGSEKLEDHEFTWLTISMGKLLLQSEEDTEGDSERFRQLYVMYDDLQKRKTKLRIKCPGCNRSLKGVTEEMIGDIGVCPKCRAEFTIKRRDETSRDEETE